MAKRKTWDERETNTFRGLCRIMCSKDEVCSVMGVSPNELDRLIADSFTGVIPHKGKFATFDEAFSAFSAEGKMSIRRKQFELAMDGDKAMLTWLGKQYLGQTDSGKKQESEKPKASTEKATVLELAASNRAKRASKAV